jgi:hypothetical protein
MIPLASDLLPFPGQIRREDLLEVQSARPASFIRPRSDSGHYFSEVSRGSSGSVNKSPVVWQCSHRRHGTGALGNKRDAVRLAFRSTKFVVVNQVRPQ